MNIESYQKSNGKTCYMFRIYLGIDPLTGQRIQTARRGFDSKKAAETAYMRLKLENEGKTIQKNKRYRFREIYKEWILQYEKTVKESTYAKTVSLFRIHILPKIGRFYIDAIQLKDMQKCVNEWFEVHSKYKELTNYSAKVFQYAQRLEYIKTNPCDLVQMPRVIKDHTELAEENYYDRDELQTFLNSAKELLPTMWYTLFRLLAFTGIRKGEGLILTWEDVDLEGGRLKIKKTMALDRNNDIIVQTPKTAEGVREVDIDPETVRILKDWHREQIRLFGQLGINTMKPGQLLFSNSKNTFINLQRPGQFMDRVIDEKRLKRVTPHGLRHTHCAMLFEAGATIPQVQARLGHKDIQTTMNIYNHVTKKQKEEAVQKLAAYLNF